MLTRLIISLAGAAACALLISAKKPRPLQPARPAAEAAAAFYPEIEKHVAYYARWAATAAGAELDTCRSHYRRAILDAFGDFSVARRREFAQTRWKLTLTMSCKGKSGETRTCAKTFAAPMGQEFDTAGMVLSGRGFSPRPAASANRRHLDVRVAKRGEGISRSRIVVLTRRTVEDMERELARELEKLREKLERHGLPSDKTVGKYEP